jgi:hypothetical protein
VCIAISMLSMRMLLRADPFLPIETRQRIADDDRAAHDDLVRLGLNHCEAAELLDELPEGYCCG